MACGNFLVELRWIQEGWPHGGEKPKYKKRIPPFRVLVFDLGWRNREWEYRTKFLVTDITRPKRNQRTLAEEISFEQRHQEELRLLRRFLKRFGIRRRGEAIPCFEIELWVLVAVLELMHQNPVALARIMKASDNKTELKIHLGLYDDEKPRPPKRGSVFLQFVSKPSSST